jgi:class 3 adenylate cyclase
MDTDEEGTLARLRAYRRELLAPKIDEHRGRVVKTTGDDLLIEFPSFVDAARGAARYSARWDAIAPMPRQNGGSSSRRHMDGRPAQGRLAGGVKRFVLRRVAPASIDLIPDCRQLL